MKGLFWKDLYTIRRFMKQYLMMVIFAFALTFATKISVYLNIMLMIMAMSLIISLLSVDEKEKWYDIILTMPVGRKLIVKEKYILLSVCMAGVLLVSAVWGALLSIIVKESYRDYLLSTCVMMFFYLIMISIIMPLIYKYGTEKVRIMMMAVFGVPAVVLVLLAEVLSFTDFALENFLLKFIYFIPVVLVVVLFLSYKQSVKVFSEKEF